MYAHDPYDGESLEIDEPSYAVGESSVVRTPRTATSPTATGPPKIGCWGRWKREINPFQPWFNVEESNGRKIDVAESFAPGTCCAFFHKLIMLSLTIFILAYTWATDGHAYFYLAFLTYWSLLVSTLYLIMSFINTVFSGRTPQPADKVTGRLKLTWILFTMAAHAELAVVLLYWTLVYGGGKPEWTTLFIHGIICLLVWYDGLGVNRIPVRWMHFYGFVWTYDFIYLIWTVLHAVFNVGNPDSHDNDPTTNDDLLYTNIDWKGDTVKTIITAAIVLFVISPLLYLLLWLASSYTCLVCCSKDRRRYLDTFKDEQTHERPTVNDVEEGSIFAKFW